VIYHFVAIVNLRSTNESPSTWKRSLIRRDGCKHEAQLTLLGSGDRLAPLLVFREREERHSQARGKE